MQIKQQREAKSPRLKINLWKKIGKSQSFNQNDRLLQTPQSPKMSKSNVHTFNDYLTINRMSKLSSNSSHSDRVISDQQSQSKNGTSSNLKSSTSIYEEMKAQGIEIKNIDDSQSIVEEEEVIEESDFQSEFHKYSSRFKIKCLLQPKSSIQSGSVGYSQSEQFSPLPPFIDPSLINSSSRNFSKIVIKLKQSTQQLSAVKAQLKHMYHLFDEFTFEFIRFIQTQDLQFKNLLRSCRVSKSDSLIQTYLKAREPSMIMEQDEQHLSFSIKKSQFHEQVDLSCFIGDEKDLTPLKLERKHIDLQLQHNSLQSPHFKSNPYQNLTLNQLNRTDPDQEINTLKILISEKDAQIEALKHQMQTEKIEYLQYKKLFGQTNNELNAELDCMVEKLKTEEQKYECLEQQFLKLKEMVQLKSSMTKENVKSSLMKSSKHNLKESHVLEDDWQQISKLKSKLKDLQTLNSKINNQLTDFKQENQRLSQILVEKNVQLEQKILQLASKTQQIAEKTQQLNSLRLEVEEHLGELPVWTKLESITEQKTKFKKSFSFGQLRRNLTIGSVSSQKQSKQTIHNIHNSQILNHSPLNPNFNPDQLFKIKQHKLKQYQQQIQKLLFTLNQQNFKLQQFQKQLQKLSQYQSRNQQLQSQLEQTKNSIQSIQKIRFEIQQSNHKLYEHIFDLEQRTAKAQNDYDEYVNVTSQLIRQQKIKKEQTQALYKELLNKIDSTSHVSTIPIIQIPSLSSLNHQSDPQNLIKEIKLYKQLYEQKKSQLQELNKKNTHKRQNQIINENLQKQADKFRIQALRQDVLVQDQIIRKLQEEKDELLQKVKQLSKKLADKDYSLEKLNIELRKQKSHYQNHKNIPPITGYQAFPSTQSFNQQRQQAEYQRKNQNQRSLEISIRQQFLRKKEQELHKTQLKIQAEQRKLSLTKKQVQSEYQTLLMKYQDVRTFNNQSMNRKSLQHLLNHSCSSKNLKTSYHQNVLTYACGNNSPTDKQVFERSRNLLTSRCQSPEQKSLEAQKIINELRDRQFRPTSDRESYLNKDMFSRVQFSPNIRNILSSHNALNQTQKMCKIRSTSPRNHRMQSPKRIQLTKLLPDRKQTREYQTKRQSQEKKLQLKLIEQKMKKLKQEVRDSIRQPF